MQVSFLKPLDGPTGARRLMALLKQGLARTAFTEFRCAVAYAKVGPLLRLSSSLADWRASGKWAEAILGIDQRLTSKEALQAALGLFDRVYVTYNPVPNSTFHAKFYLFRGPSEALAVFGSHNLTLGGLETNYEAGAILTMRLPEDQQTWDEAYSCWTQLAHGSCPNTHPLTPALLADLEVQGLILAEAGSRTPRPGPRHERGVRAVGVFPAVPPAAPSPLPAFTGEGPARLKRPRTSTPRIPLLRRALVIQIVPHHNGEIFLSKRAVNDDPDFFCYPFTGRTVPKKAGNPSYPQRVPDPSVYLNIYGRTGEHIRAEDIPNLNMVYYKLKSEIRITVSPGLARDIPPYSILVMCRTDPGSDHDYTMDVFAPGSPLYDSYLASCTTELPSGGRLRPRRMGWI